MISGALNETVIEEAEAIVRAEWMRVQHEGAWHEQVRPAPCSEMPAALPCIVTLATIAIVEPSRPLLGRRRTGLARRGGPQRRVWPTQRSPPRNRRACRMA